MKRPWVIQRVALLTVKLTRGVDACSVGLPQQLGRQRRLDKPASKELNLGRCLALNNRWGGGRQNIPIHTDITYQHEKLIDDRPPGLSLSESDAGQPQRPEPKGKRSKALDPYMLGVGLIGTAVVDAYFTKSR